MGYWVFCDFLCHKGFPENKDLQWANTFLEPTVWLLARSHAWVMRMTENGFYHYIKIAGLSSHHPEMMSDGTLDQIIDGRLAFVKILSIQGKEKPGYEYARNQDFK